MDQELSVSYQSLVDLLIDRLLRFHTKGGNCTRCGIQATSKRQLLGNGSGFHPRTLTISDQPRLENQYSSNNQTRVDRTCRLFPQARFHQI